MNDVAKKALNDVIVKLYLRHGFNEFTDKQLYSIFKNPADSGIFYSDLHSLAIEDKYEYYDDIWALDPEKVNPIIKEILDGCD